MSYHLGIDLGTTYTGAARFSEGRGEIITLGDRSAVVPSVLFMREDGDVLAGDPAVRRGVSDPTRVVREFKRRMGDPTPIMVGHSPYSADRLMAELLDTVLGIVSQREGGPPEAIGITHPANWGPYKQDILRQAIRLANVGDAVILSEPEAAAIHYAWTERLEAGEIVAVYDLGGGTFDAAVLRKTAGDQRFEILGEAEGIERLGGIDFDEAVYQYVVRFLGSAFHNLDVEDPAVVQGVARLRQECVAAKEALSSDTDVSIPVFLPTIQTEVRLTRPEFESMIRPALGETIDALRRALRGAAVEADDLSAVLLVGGSSRIPLVSQLVTAELGRPTALDVHPKHTVAVGAAIAAFNASDSAGSVTSITPTPEPVTDSDSDSEPKVSLLAATGSDGPTAQVGEDTRPLALVTDRPPIGRTSTPLEGHEQPTEASEPASPLERRSPAADIPEVADPAPGFPPGGAPPPPASGGGSGRGRAVVAAMIALATVVVGVVVLTSGNDPDDLQASPTTVLSDGSTTVATEATTTTTQAVTTTIDPIEVRAPQALQVVDSTGDAGFVVRADAGADQAAIGALPALTTFTTTGKVQSVDGYEWYELEEPIAGGWVEAELTQEVEAGERVTITDIAVEDGRYVVGYEANYEPLIGSGDSVHIHFFWNVYDVHEAGAGPDAKTWILYDIPAPFQEYAVSDRPEGATQMCATPATSSHEVLNERSFHCMDLPDLENATAPGPMTVGLDPAHALGVGPCVLDPGPPREL